MKFEELIKDLEYERIIGEPPCEIVDVTDYSKEVVKGGLFFYSNGDNKESDKFLIEAERLGAVTVVTEREVKTALCQIIVKDLKRATSDICKAFLNNPQEDMRIIGVVGTNGKTTICHLLYSIFKNSGYEVGVTGTIGTYYKEFMRESSLTTLGTVKLYKLIKEMADSGVEILFMEVSAHAIEQRRVDGIFFDALIFTNCTQDHLDYFGDMDNYAKVKKSLFSPTNCKYMIVNSDDKIGREIINGSCGKVISYGIDNPADVFAIDVSEKEDGTEFVINLFDIIYGIKSNLLGEYNVYNILAACTLSATFGINVYEMASALEKLQPIEGRVETVAQYKGARIVVDYAHTPDGLEKTLKSMKKICKGLIICVFGCGGNREKEKRPIMGEISGEIADFTILTSDNPRFEDPYSIIKEIENGIKKVTRKYLTVNDRETAIRYALDLSGEGDIVVIAGKGAEKYQEILGQKRFFSDREVVLRYISNKGDKN